MTWPRRRTGSLWPRGWFRRCWGCGGRSALLCFAAALLTILPGCCWNSTTRPTPPILSSLQRLTLDGVPGLWMDAADAGRLASWTRDVIGD